LALRREFVPRRSFVACTKLVGVLSDVETALKSSPFPDRQLEVAHHTVRKMVRNAGCELDSETFKTTGLGAPECYDLLSAWKDTHAPMTVEGWRKRAGQDAFLPALKAILTLTDVLARSGCGPHELEAEFEERRRAGILHG